MYKRQHQLNVIESKRKADRNAFLTCIRAGAPKRWQLEIYQRIACLHTYNNTLYINDISTTFKMEQRRNKKKKNKTALSTPL